MAEFIQLLSNRSVFDGRCLCNSLFEHALHTSRNEAEQWRPKLKIYCAGVMSNFHRVTLHLSKLNTPFCRKIIQWCLLQFYIIDMSSNKRIFFFFFQIEQEMKLYRKTCSQIQQYIGLKELRKLLFYYLLFIVDFWSSPVLQTLGYLSGGIPDRFILQIVNISEYQITNRGRSRSIYLYADRRI